MIGTVSRGAFSDDEFSKLDLSVLTFPSDALSIGQLRRAHAKLFDIGFGVADESQPLFFFKIAEGDSAADIVAEMLQCERLIAVDAYSKQRGVAAPDMFVSLDDLKQQLSATYVEYGIAQGSHHAAELIRNIERQGSDLAKGRCP